MIYPYHDVFQKTKNSLIAYGSQHRPTDQILKSLDEFKTYEGRVLTDDQYFSILVNVVFYSGFRAATVTARVETIRRWFPDWRTVAKYNRDDVDKIMADPGMIRNEKKIKACIENALAIQEIISKQGSFSNYIASFSPTDSFENLLLLKEELEARFYYLGGVTVYHFLTDIGMPVLKPDRVISRIFQRLGLIENEKQLLKTVLQGRKFAEANGLPIRYIDIVFVAYGQARTEELGMDRGICLEKPRCTFCGLKDYCRKYQESSGIL